MHTVLVGHKNYSRYTQNINRSPFHCDIKHNGDSLCIVYFSTHRYTDVSFVTKITRSDNPYDPIKFKYFHIVF